MSGLLAVIAAVGAFLNISAFIMAVERGTFILVPLFIAGTIAMTIGYLTYSKTYREENEEELRPSYTDL